MTTFLLLALLAECSAIVLWSMKRKDRIIQFPFLASAVMFGFLIPQLWGLRNSLYVPEHGLDKTIVMAILCVGALWIGYAYNRRPARLFQWKYDRNRLVVASVALSLTGAYFFFKVSSLASEAVENFGGQWSGPITIYVFFSSLLTYGLVLALLLHLEKPSKLSLVVIVFDLMFYLDRIIVQGRRAAMAELAIMLLFALWFKRRYVPPKLAVVALVIVGALVINSIGDYRSIMLDKEQTWSGAGWNEISQIDFIGNLGNIFRGKSEAYELSNAALNIEAADQLLSFDFGLSHWNGFVDAYVPGQLVGRDLKKSLKLDFKNPAEIYFGHVPHTGTTLTGLTDAFLSFWYFGAIKFYLIGLILSRWYWAAVRDNIAAQTILILAMTPALHALTHSTHNFFTVFVSLAVFLVPVLLWARSGVGQVSAKHSGKMI